MATPPKQFSWSSSSSGPPAGSRETTNGKSASAASASALSSVFKPGSPTAPGGGSASTAFKSAPTFGTGTAAGGSQTSSFLGAGRAPETPGAPGGFRTAGAGATPGSQTSFGQAAAGTQSTAFGQTRHVPPVGGSALAQGARPATASAFMPSSGTTPASGASFAARSGVLGTTPPGSGTTFGTGSTLGSSSIFGSGTAFGSSPTLGSSSIFGSGTAFGAAASTGTQSSVFGSSLGGSFGAARPATAGPFSGTATAGAVPPRPTFTAGQTPSPGAVPPSFPPKAPGPGAFTGTATPRPAGATPPPAAPRPLIAPASSMPGAVTPPSPFRKEIRVSEEEFVQLRDFIYQKCGIFIAENRKYLIENRLSNRLKELNLKSYGEYYNFLRFDASKNSELTRLYEFVTTNETSFYRNPPQLEIFKDAVLTKLVNELRQQGKKRLRIWSAGCSTGEEPYTLAIIIHEVLKGEVGSWDIKITANDLSEAVLAVARRGFYNEYTLRTTPKEIVDNYFTKDGNLFRINDGPKRLVSFGQINLNDREQVRRVETSQIVFCRNVIIYFDDDMKRRVISAFYDNLEPNGALLIGHSESLHNLSRSFRLEQFKGTIVYRKIV